MGLFLGGAFNEQENLELAIVLLFKCFITWSISDIFYFGL